MSVTEAQRHRLDETLKIRLGEAEAETFMSMQSPFDRDQVATKADLSLTGARLTAEIHTAIAGQTRWFVGANTALVGAVLAAATWLF